MSRFSQYWALIAFSATGQHTSQQQPAAQKLIQQLYPGVQANGEVINDRHLQRQLLTQANGDFNSPAMMALRCYISHQTLAICSNFAKKFGQKHSFQTQDLLGYVLDDNGKPASAKDRYQIRSAQILKKFDPAKSSLSTWTKQLIHTDKDLNAFFNQQGLRLISDWALLNTATRGKIKRLFLGAATLNKNLALLEAYHQVYRQARLMTGDRSPCKEPSIQQCEAISDLLSAQSFSLSSNQVPGELLALAKLIREDDISVKRGAPPSQSLDVPEQQAKLEAIAIEGDPKIEDEIPWELLVERYQAELSACLHRAAKDVITKRHQRLKPKKAKIYPTAMLLRYCEGWKMAEIAPHVGINDQTGVTRLLDLKHLRADLRHQAIACLQCQLSEILSPYMKPDQLAELDQRLENLLGSELDQLIKAEADETQTPRQYVTERSRLAQVISQVLQEIYPTP